MIHNESIFYDVILCIGSDDGRLRLWNIPNKKVALWNEIEGVFFNHATSVEDPHRHEQDALQKR